MTAIKNQRGQGSVEYILIIAIAVAVVLGGIYQLNSAARVFADKYFGDYLTCLLETGELPTLGGTAVQGQCNQEYKPFNLADGRSPIPPGGGGGGGNPNDKDEDNPNDAIAGNGSGGGSSGNSDGDGGSGRFGAAGFSKSGARTRVRGGGGEEEDKNNSSSSSGSAYRDGYDANKVTRFPVRDLAGVSGRRGRLNEKEETRTKVTSTSKDGQNAAGQPMRIKVRTITSNIIPEEEAVDWGFGGLLRYLIIIIIIIAIVVFLGGQALQISKNS
jgi:hypothetical protein